MNSTQNPIVCKDPQTIDAFFDSKTFSFAFVNSYFDLNDYEDEIKHFIDDSLFWELDTRLIKKSNIYIQKNLASL